MGNRGDFAKAFSEHRRTGGTMSRKDFGETYRLMHKKMIDDTPKIPDVEAQQADDVEEFT
jgi:hypothetical protein